MQKDCSGQKNINKQQYASEAPLFKSNPTTLNQITVCCLSQANIIIFSGNLKQRYAVEILRHPADYVDE